MSNKQLTKIFLVSLFLVSLFPLDASAASLLKPANNLGLVGYWSFNEGSGTVATDFSGNGNAGTLTNGPTWTNGKFGKAVSFDGSNDYVQVTDADNLDGGTELTISAWVYARTAGQNGFGRIVAKGDGTPYNLAILGPTLFEFKVEGVSLGSGHVFSLNAWHHVVATWNSTTKALYVDGVLVNSTGASGSISAGSNDLYIGNRSDGTRTFDGLIDEVRIYNRALTATQVAALYQSGARAVNTSQNQSGGSLDQGLVGLWSFDGKDISGTTAYDRSGSGNNGTLTNGPTRTIGKVGQALNFDGSTQWVTTSGSYPTGTNPRTLCAWVKSDDTTFEGNADHVVNYGTAADNQAFGFMIHTGNQWRFFGFGGSVDFDTGISVDTNWHQHCITYDGTTVIYFYDGVNAASQSRTLATTGGNMAFATRPDLTSSDAFNGKIDEVRVYNRALSVSEVKQLYQRGSAKANVSQNVTGSSLDSGLAGMWSFNGQDISGTTAYDRSGSGKHLTLTNGPTVVIGKSGQGLRFDGSNDYAESTFTNPTGGNLTISAWAKINETTALSNAIVSLVTGPQGSSNYSPYIGFNNSGQPIAVGFDGSVKTATYASADLGAWHLITAVFKTSSTIDLYVDGVLRNSVAVGSLYAGNTYAVLSFVKASETSYFNGSIDEVRIYNRALSAAEVKQLYNLGK